MLLVIGMGAGRGVAGAVVVDRVAPPPPPITAEAAFVFDATAGAALYELNPDERRPPASLTKIATALVVLQRARLDEVATVGEEDLADLTESQVGLIAGDQLTVGELLYGLLVPSGNDAARTLARHVGGSLPGGDADPTGAFVAAMNDLVAGLGLVNTTFTNPSGIHDPAHLSTARDLALLAARAMEQPIFAEIVATASYVLVSALDPAQVYPVVNTNRLLLEGLVAGVKTGTTLEAGGCLVTASTIAGNRVISVVLDATVYVDADGAPKSDDRFTDIQTILASLANDYVWVDPADPASVPGLADEMAAWQIGLEPGRLVPLPVAQTGDVRYRLVLGPPGEPNAEVGKVVFFVGADRLAEQPVYQTGTTVAARLAPAAA